MATYTWDKPLIAEEGETASLTTTASYLAFKPGFDGVIMYSASAWRRALSPALKAVLYYSASAGTYTNYTAYAKDRSSSTHVPLDAMGTSDYLYIGCNEPFLGLYFDIGTNANDQDVELDMEYCTTAVAPGATLAFTDVSGDSDGTDSSGTLAVDGVYTWTLPTDWVRSQLGTSADPAYGKIYWVRFAPTGSLGTTVDINEIIPVYQNANYGYKEAATSYVDQLNFARNGGFVLKGTTSQTLDVTWLRHG